MTELTFLLDGVLGWNETYSTCRFFISVPSLQSVTKSYDLLTYALARAGQISLSIFLQIWPRESVRPMVFGSAKTVWKLPTHLGPILRAVLRQMSLKLLTDITGKTVQVNTFLTFSRLNLIFFSIFQVIFTQWHIILVFSKWSDTVYPLYPYSHHSVFYQHLGKKNYKIRVILRSN